MMRSLYSGVSGLRVHQTKMDVIGNNISNVNTVGFKSSTVNFSDILYQTTQSASGPNPQTGLTGMNAKQIGLGATVASIKTQITTRGGSQRTDNAFDMMINSDAFFIVNSGGSNYFTKSGAFEVDAAGTLCTSDGAAVMGWQVDPADPNKTIPGQVTPLTVMSPANRTTPPEFTTKTYITGNIDQADTQMKTGCPTQIQFYDSLGNLMTAKLVVKQDPVDKSNYTVDLTDILNQNNESIFAVKNPDGTFAQSTTTVTLGGNAYTATVDATTGAVTLAGGGASPLLQFDKGSGKFVGIGAAAATTPSVGLVIADPTRPGLYAPNVDVDFSTLTQFATGKTALEAKKGGVGQAGLGAGKPLGKMIGIGVDGTGKIYGSYTNGDKKLLGQLAVASFENPAGLEAVGNNRFASTQNSGDFDGIGRDVSADGGSFTSGVLEMSNVDLSQQFTDMITTQRGFQANSRIITNSDTLLEELINLKR